MGRRSLHKPEELRELILDAAQRIIETGGIGQLSAREVAREIGYAPGTLYNMYDNLAEILLRVEVRLLEQLDAALAREIGQEVGAEAVRRFASCYVTFAFSNLRLWALLQEHNPALSTAAPEWYLEKLFAPAVRLESPMAKLMAKNNANEVSQSACALWRAIHGMTTLGACTKLGAPQLEQTRAMVEHIVEGYLAGFAGFKPKSMTPRQFPQADAGAAA